MNNKLYPKIEPYNKFFLKVSKIHTIFVEESGNPKVNQLFFYMVVLVVE